MRGEGVGDGFWGLERGIWGLVVDVGFLFDKRGMGSAYANDGFDGGRSLFTIYVRA